MWDEGNYALCAVVTLAMQMSLCVLAFFMQTDKLTDFSGCCNFIVLAMLTSYLGQAYNSRQLVVTAVVCLWALRLVIYLVCRILKTGHDERFDKFRSNFSKFAMFWIIQALWVFVVSLPVMVLNSPSSSSLQGKLKVVPLLDWVGTFLLVLGLAVESTADWQKFNFRLQAANRGRFCNTGLWRFSRHPNYFGEIALWWGVFLVTTNGTHGVTRFVTLLSPLFTTLLLLFLSGLPLLERSSDRKYGHLTEYWSYKQTTSPLIPLPPALYNVLPYYIRLIFFFEYPMYNRRARRASEKHK